MCNSRSGTVMCVIKLAEHTRELGWYGNPVLYVGGILLHFLRNIYSPQKYKNKYLLWASSYLCITCTSCQTFYV